MAWTQWQRQCQRPREEDRTCGNTVNSRLNHLHTVPSSLQKKTAVVEVFMSDVASKLSSLDPRVHPRLLSEGHKFRRSYEAIQLGFHASEPPAVLVSRRWKSMEPHFSGARKARLRRSPAALWALSKNGPKGVAMLVMRSSGSPSELRSLRSLRLSAVAHTRANVRIGRHGRVGYRASDGSWARQRESIALNMKSHGIGSQQRPTRSLLSSTSGTFRVTRTRRVSAATSGFCLLFLLRQAVVPGSAPTGSATRRTWSPPFRSFAIFGPPKSEAPWTSSGAGPRRTRTVPSLLRVEPGVGPGRFRGVPSSLS